jgi:hypothetical protein
VTFDGRLEDLHRRRERSGLQLSDYAPLQTSREIEF